MSDDMAYKAEKLKQLVAAIDYVLTNWDKHDDKQFQALHLQNLRDQRKTLLATFPPIRLVVDNTHGRPNGSVLHFPEYHRRQGSLGHKRDPG
jgi:hypothetical protein